MPECQVSGFGFRFMLLQGWPNIQSSSQFFDKGQAPMDKLATVKHQHTY